MRERHGHGEMEWIRTWWDASAMKIGEGKEREDTGQPARLPTKEGEGGRAWRWKRREKRGQACRSDPTRIKFARVPIRGTSSRNGGPLSCRSLHVDACSFASKRWNRPSNGARANQPEPFQGRSSLPRLAFLRLQGRKNRVVPSPSQIPRRRRDGTSHPRVISGSGWPPPVRGRAAA